MESFYFTKKEELDAFIEGIADARGAEFLQSWQWGELLQAEKAEILRIGARSEGNILAAATIIKNSLPGGYHYWYSPRGIVFKSGLSKEERAKAEDFLLLELKKLDKRAVFFRIEPKEKIASRRFKIEKTLDLQPKQTLILDLTLNEDDLLKAMHQKTRYNINLATKKGIEIKEGSSEDFPEFWRLMNLTGERDDFRLHSAEHYRSLLENRATDRNVKSGLSGQANSNFIRLFFASYEGRNIAAGMFCFWGDKVTYMHGASDNEFRNVMAPYLLQWSLIKIAKKEGYKYYDFYGIDEKKWPGVTRFKLGFGGRIENYSGTHDVIFSPVLYGFYEFIRKIRRLI
ncbi:MAG: peptidoglycan bridge formation glycyltransferase FemA/FemB family protein [Patescibacteria group bacterium]|jgi:lipid II:glycine glycyltransferase (peptidoglycan interpeptide bridge formation enzyme)